MFDGEGGGGNCYGAAIRPPQNSNNQIQTPNLNPNPTLIDSLDCPTTAPAPATSYKCPAVLVADTPMSSSAHSSSSSSPEATRAKRKHPSSRDAPTPARATATSSAQSSGASGTDCSHSASSNNPSNERAQHAGPTPASSPPLSRASPLEPVSCREGAAHANFHSPCLPESRSSTSREAPASAEGATVRVPWALTPTPTATHTPASSATQAPAADPLRCTSVQNASAPAIALPLPIASAIVHVSVPPSESGSNSEAALLEACEQHLAALGIDMSDTPGSWNYSYRSDRNMNTPTPSSGIARWTSRSSSARAADKCTGWSGANATLSLNGAPNMWGDSCISDENRVSISANECAHIASTRHAPQTRAEALDTLGENSAAEAHFSGGSNTHSHSRSHWGTQTSGDSEYICSKPAAFSADNTSKSTSRISWNSEFQATSPAAPSTTSTTATSTWPALDSKVPPSFDTDRNCNSSCCCSDNEHTMSTMPAGAVCKKLLVLHVATAGHNDELEFGVDEAPIVLLAYVLLDVETNTKVRSACLLLLFATFCTTSI